MVDNKLDGGQARDHVGVYGMAGRRVMGKLSFVQDRMVVALQNGVASILQLQADFDGRSYIRGSSSDHGTGRRFNACFACSTITLNFYR